ncbi:MAG: DUF222 domain-containing protein, partial [Gammaproteobacteria bacterium]|nr:DUF222 domain-containing protein [Gemmatimonadota bacterium]NIR35108.1 DUF222 domain-containing protein [Actinomycetota bacterium]NIU78965.1 DUF222 domain-containing protein [Gammaproteobacteria bacterium]NIT87004.1 DUF222 domain-containing protein [Gemmatimonadota bacterium]NIV86294.1 DUF222 domain-containing protein [Actinomycetota bacterium]
WRLHGRLAGTDGAAVEKALDRRADQITQGVDRRPPLAQRRADALVDLCHTSSGTSGSTSEPLVTVFVDTHGATINGYLPVGTDTLDEALCTGSLEVIDLTDPGTPLARGHTSRVIPRKLRRAVFWRDGGRCAIDGCSSRYRIQPHHIIPRAHHGEHQLDNLVTLCWYHHHIVVHGHGRRIDPASPPQRRRFLTTPERAPPH